jgi:hypothetical protein
LAVVVAGEFSSHKHKGSFMVFNLLTPSLEFTPSDWISPWTIRLQEIIGAKSEIIASPNPTFSARFPMILATPYQNPFSGPSSIPIPKPITARFHVTFPPASTLGILSSHLSKNAFCEPAWQRSLQTALKLAKELDSVVLFPNGAPYSPSIAYACDKLNIASLEIQTKDRSNDQAVTFLATRVVALALKPRGKIATLLERRLLEPEIPRHTTWVLCELHPQSPGPSKATKPTDKVQTKNPKTTLIDKAQQVNKELCDKGAVLWIQPRTSITQANALSESSPWRCALRTVPATRQPIAPITDSLYNQQSYFIHCTRARQHRWPDQSDQDMLDEVFQEDWTPTASPLDSLHRILRTQRLCATTHCRRGDYATICFTENNLATLQSMRTFQSHLARWDWEPYGLAFPKHWLIPLGIKQVRYLPKPQIDRLPADEQVFCQPSPNESSTNDWRLEREWRLTGDLRLSTLTRQPKVSHSSIHPESCDHPNDICDSRLNTTSKGGSLPFVFVRSESDAHAMGSYSRWPVYWLEDRK